MFTGERAALLSASTDDVGSECQAKKLAADTASDFRRLKLVHQRETVPNETACGAEGLASQSDELSHHGDCDRLVAPIWTP